jgi:urea transport system substrate-binding protein
LGLFAVVGVVALVSELAAGRDPIAPLKRLLASTRPPIVIGLIHSQTGGLAISEKSLLDAEMLAIDEINARGGVTGRLLKAETADGRSEASTFAAEAARLIEREKAEVLVGGWTSECRKALLGVVEAKDNLLIFPSNYEGIEASAHVIYSCGSANQVVFPGVRWCLDQLKAKSFYIVGTEEIWSRVVAEMAKDAVKAAGATVVGETYWPMGGGDADATVAAIRQAKPDIVLDVLVGDGNMPFFAALRRAGSTPEKLPVLAFNVSEDEMRRFPPGDLTGYYAAWSYFQSIDRPENADFVRRFKARYGQDRVVSDSMVAAYNGLMIWSHAVDEAGTGDPKVVRNWFDRLSLDAAEGVVTIDPESRAAWRPFHVGRARADGQFEVVFAIRKPTQPVAFPATRPKNRWLALLEEHRARWGGRWSSAGSAVASTDR